MMEIIPFSAEYQSGVIALILPIQQQEFGIPITLQDQTDLLNIPAFYQRSAGNFWLALQDARVIGSIALLDIGEGQGAVRKMFVAAPFRGGQHGVAGRLLDTLLSWCRQKQMREIYLGTTAQFKAAQRFYRKNGFIEIDKQALPARFPLMAVDSVFFGKRIEVETS